MVFIISIGKIDKYLIFPIIGGIIICFSTPIYYAEPIPIFLNYPFIFSIISGLSMCIAIIPFLISKVLSKKQIQTKEYIEKKKKMRLRKFLFIFIASLFEFSQSILMAFGIFRKIFNFWTIDIIIIYLFSYFILKTRLHRHHYLGAIIILISNIALFKLQLKYFDWESNEIILGFLFEIFMPFILVINKYNMEYQFCSPYELCFYTGIFSTILYVISSLLFSIKEKDYLNHYLEYFNQFNFRELYMVLIFMIITFIYNISLYLTIKYYNPFYILIILVITEISSIFVDTISLDYLAFYIIDFILFLAICIFNEIIEINCFSLEKKTRRNLEKNANLETLIVEENINDERTSNISDSEIDFGNYKVELNKMPSIE